MTCNHGFVWLHIRFHDCTSACQMFLGRSGVWGHSLIGVYSYTRSEGFSPSGAADWGCKPKEQNIKRMSPVEFDPRPQAQSTPCRDAPDHKVLGKFQRPNVPRKFDPRSRVECAVTHQTKNILGKFLKRFSSWSCKCFQIFFFKKNCNLKHFYETPMLF